MPKLVQMLAIAGLIATTEANANAASMLFDCDAEGGHYSELVQSQTGPNYALRADISAKRFGQHRDWHPGARMAITSADGKNSIIMQLAAGSVRPEFLLVSLVTNRDGEQKQYMVTTVNPGEAVHASIDVRDDVVHVEVAGQLAEVPLKLGAGAKVSVGCSTGQFMFENLDLAATR